MSCEKALITTHNQGDNGASESAVEEESAVCAWYVALGSAHLPIGGLSRFSCIFIFVCSR